MSPEFPTPQTTVSEINFTLLSQEINRQLLAGQEAIRNFNIKVFSYNDPRADEFRRSINPTQLPVIPNRKEGLEESAFLTNGSIQEFKQIILEEQGIELTDQEAHEDALAFLGAFKILVTNTSLILKSPVDTQERQYG